MLGQIRILISQELVDKYGEENPDVIDKDTNELVLKTPCTENPYVRDAVTREVQEGFGKRFPTSTFTARQWQPVTPGGSVDLKRILDELSESPSIPCKNGFEPTETEDYEEMNIAILSVDRVKQPVKLNGFGRRFAASLRVLISEV